MLALRDAAELVAVLAFVVIVPSLIERVLVQNGISTVGTGRILATGSIFVLWAGFILLLMRLNREPLSSVGLARPHNPRQTVVQGLLVAIAIFAVVVTLEQFGHGKDRLSDIGRELKDDAGPMAERMVVSVLIVGVVEEFVFRGFIMLRLANLFGGSSAAWTLALVGQATIFGLSHGQQHLYGMVLTGAIGLFVGAVYLMTGRNLWVVIIGHGFYDAAHAAYISAWRLST